MFLSKMVVRLFLLFTFCLSSSLLYADPISITKIDDVVEHVKALRHSGIQPESIGVILDCHGVVTEEEGHSMSHTLKGNIREALTYFKEEGISIVIATAWNKLDEVVEQAVVATGLGDFFGVEPGKETKPEDFAVGPAGAVKLTGHKNGKVVALKNAEDVHKVYSRQKIFALEVTHPGRVFTNIALADDDTGNLETAENDFPRTQHYSDGCSLKLFHLKSPKPVLSLSNGLQFYPPSMQSLSTVRLSLPSSQPSPFAVPTVQSHPFINYVAYDSPPRDDKIYYEYESPPPENNFHDGYEDFSDN